MQCIFTAEESSEHCSVCNPCQRLEYWDLLGVKHHDDMQAEPLDDGYTTNKWKVAHAAGGAHCRAARRAAARARAARWRSRRPPQCRWARPRSGSGSSPGTAPAGPRKPPPRAPAARPPARTARWGFRVFPNAASLSLRRKPAGPPGRRQQLPGLILFIGFVSCSRPSPATHLAGVHACRSGQDQRQVL